MARMNIRAILADPVARRALIIRCIISAQALEGIDTTPEQAAHAYDTVQLEADAIRARARAHDPKPRKRSRS